MFGWMSVSERACWQQAVSVEALPGTRKAGAVERLCRWPRDCVDADHAYDESIWKTCGIRLG